MAARQYTLRISGNPLVRALWMVLGAALLVGAVIMGAVVLTALLALGAVAAAVLAIRVWWLRRKLLRGGAFDVAGPHATDGDAADRPAPQLIEAEYTVVAERDAPDAGKAPGAGDAPDAGERPRPDRRASQ
jgi:hypothetical protein